MAGSSKAGEYVYENEIDWAVYYEDDEVSRYEDGISCEYCDFFERIDYDSGYCHHPKAYTEITDIADFCDKHSSL